MSLRGNVNIICRHEKQVDRLRQIAEKSLNISTEAYEISKDAVKKQGNITEELGMLDQEMSRIENKVDAVMSTAEKAQEMANKVGQCEVDKILKSCLCLYSLVQNCRRKKKLLGYTKKFTISSCRM